VVDPSICRGCGICAAECPTGAMQLGGFSDAELIAEATAS
jgi:heterodisulfide reductase subunit A